MVLPMQQLSCAFDPGAAADFAALLGRPGAPLNLRAFPPTSASAETKKRIGPRKPPWGNADAITTCQLEGRGIYAVINPGGDNKASITHAVAHFAESDDGTKDEQWAKVAASPLPPPSFVVDGGGRSLHFYWVFSTWSTDLAAWQSGPGAVVEVGLPVDHGDGTVTRTFRSLEPVSAQVRQFMRLRMSN